jgi:hypothetical protein
MASYVARCAIGVMPVRNHVRNVVPASPVEVKTGGATVTMRDRVALTMTDRA